MEGNKASVCSYMNTLMRRSVGVETNSCFIMFTCGWTLWSSALHSHCWRGWHSHDHVYLCVHVYQILCVFDVAAVYLCGCVAIWSDRLFVLDRMDTGGKGPRAACCLCDSLLPVSALTHVVLAVWTGHLLRFVRISLRILVEKLPLVL